MIYDTRIMNEENEIAESNMQSHRREWIDAERKRNPNFAPDIESWKELLTSEQLQEVQEYEELSHKLNAFRGREDGYKPYVLKLIEKTRIVKLHEKYGRCYFNT